MTGSVKSLEDTTTVTAFVTAHLPKSDPNRIYRIVGFLEYAMALKYLDQLALAASVEEMDAINEIIKSEPEFKIYTNLARKLPMPPSSLAERPQNEQDDFSRHGFKWVTALARVELGGMLAGFSLHPAPFAAVAGKGYDAEEYMELLVDGARTHYWAMVNDPKFKQILRKFEPNGETLTYLRRLNLTEAFIGAAVAIAPQKYAPVQVAEFQSFLKPIKDARQNLRLSIELHLSQVRTASTTSKNKYSIVEECLDGVCRTFTKD